MNKYIIMPEGCRWSVREAANHKTAYGFECSFYMPKTKIAVMDASTGETKIFSRELERNGNLKQVIEHDANTMEVI